MSRAPGAPALYNNGDPVAGIEGVVNALLWRIQTTILGDLALIEQERELAPGELSHLEPRLYSNSERSRLEANEFPAILGMGDDTGNVAVEQIGPTGDLTFSWQYNIRLYGYVRGQSTEEVSAARYGLALAVRRCVLRWPTLAVNAKAEPARWREVFLAVSPNTNFRFTSGFYLLGAVNTSEVIATPPLGIASTVDTQVVGWTD